MRVKTHLLIHDSDGKLMDFEEDDLDKDTPEK